MATKNINKNKIQHILKRWVKETLVAPWCLPILFYTCLNLAPPSFEWIKSVFRGLYLHSSLVQGLWTFSTWSSLKTSQKANLPIIMRLGHMGHMLRHMWWEICLLAGAMRLWHMRHMGLVEQKIW